RVVDEIARPDLERLEQLRCEPRLEGVTAEGTGRNGDEHQDRADAEPGSVHACRIPRLRYSPAAGGGTRMSESRPAVGAPPWRLWLYRCSVAAGAAGLILEIVWSKYLSLLLGNSIHGVATVVASFLGGLGLGAWLGGRIADRASEPLRLYARLETIVGTLGIVSPLVYLAAKPVFAGLYGAVGRAAPPLPL